VTSRWRTRQDNLVVETLAHFVQLVDTATLVIPIAIPHEGLPFIVSIDPLDAPIKTDDRREWNQRSSEGLVEDEVRELVCHDKPAMGGAAEGHNLAMGKADFKSSLCFQEAAELRSGSRIP
jgi:hypothetical protein